mmetsp:Transcript_9449/g.17668  ORF Transcript_9449/g.17668 Transcript_9449/m.17668 type:complete len:308 (+) Transcript_9449:68-991(+)
MFLCTKLICYFITRVKHLCGLPTSLRKPQRNSVMEILRVLPAQLSELLGRVGDDVDRVVVGGLEFLERNQGCCRSDHIIRLLAEACSDDAFPNRLSQVFGTLLVLLQVSEIVLQLLLILILKAIPNIIKRVIFAWLDIGSLGCLRTSASVLVVALLLIPIPSLLAAIIDRESIVVWIMQAREAPEKRAHTKVASRCGLFHFREDGLKYILPVLHGVDVIARFRRRAEFFEHERFAQHQALLNVGVHPPRRKELHAVIRAIAWLLDPQVRIHVSHGEIDSREIVKSHKVCPFAYPAVPLVASRVAVQS